MLGDLIIIPIDSLNISLGMGLSVTLKAGVKSPGWLWGAIAQWPKHLQLKQEVLGLIPGGFPGLFFFSLPAAWFTNIDEMKDLCNLAAIKTDMNEMERYMAFQSQFGCYQHIDMNTAKTSGLC